MSHVCHNQHAHVGCIVIDTISKHSIVSFLMYNVIVLYIHCTQDDEDEDGSEYEVRWG